MNSNECILATVYRVFVVISLFVSAVDADAQAAWQLFKEAPLNIVPVQLEQGSDGSLYVMTNQGEMYYRLSGNENWLSVQGIQPFWNARKFAVDPESNRLFVSTLSQGIRYTDNFGATWGAEPFFTNDFGQQASVFDILPFHDSNTILVASGFNFDLGFHTNFRSTNNGLTWQALQIPSLMLSLFRTSNGRIIGVTDVLGVYYSDDDGTSWTSVGLEGIQFGDFAETNDGTIYATVNLDISNNLGGVWVSTDQGLSWNQSNEGLTVPNANAVSYLSATDQLIIATDHGLYLRENGVWIQVPESFPDVPVRDVLLTEEQFYAGLPVLGVQVSPAGAFEWSGENDGFSSEIDNYVFNSANRVFATYSLAPGVFSAESSENPWGFQLLDELNLNAVSVLQFDRAGNGNIFILNFDEVFVSQDEGSTFQNITSNLPIPILPVPMPLSIMEVAEDGELMIAQQQQSVVFHSVNDGSTFDVLLAISDIGEPFIVHDISKSDGGHYYVSLQTAGNQRLYHSADGNLWEQVDLSSATGAGDAVGFNLEQMSGGEIVIALNHAPFIIQDEDQSLIPISVPWVFQNPNAIFDFKTDSQGNMYILTFPINGMLNYEGIWRSDDGGETWVNIGFPLNDSGIPMPAFGLGFNQNDVPFVISGEEFTDFPPGLYYYGEDGLLNTGHGFTSTEETFTVFPNPVSPDASITIQLKVISRGDRILIMDQHKRIVSDVPLADSGPATIPVNKLSDGIYFVLWFGSGTVRAMKRLVVTGR